MKLSIDKIVRNPYDTREDYGDLAGLKSSIQKQGMLHGFLVRPGKKQGEYQLVFGGRRLKSLRDLGHKEVEVQERDLKDSDMAILALCENTHRKDYNPAELARAYRVGLTVTGYPLEEFAKAIGENIGKIESYLKILSLPERILSKSSQYKVHDLLVMAKLQQLSQTLRITYEDTLNERALSVVFANEILRSCVRIFSSDLPANKKLELCGDIITQDYSHLAPKNAGHIASYTDHALERALIKYNKNLKMVAKALEARKEKGTIMPKRKKVETIHDIEDVNDRLDEVTDFLKTTTMHLERADKKGYYAIASRRNQNSFRTAVHNLASKLEQILKNGSQS